MPHTSTNTSPPPAVSPRRWAALAVIVLAGVLTALPLISFADAGSMVLLASGCSGGAEPTQPGSAAVGPSLCESAARPGSPPSRDEISPLIVSGVAPDPVPVRGTDGRYHVAYELAREKAAGLEGRVQDAEWRASQAERATLKWRQKFEDSAPPFEELGTHVAELTFLDFIVNLTPVALVTLLVVTGLLYLVFRRALWGYLGGAGLVLLLLQMLVLLSAVACWCLLLLHRMLQ